MPARPVIYAKNINLKITEGQHETLNKLRNRNIKVSQFIREAIKEKIDREASELKPKPQNSDCPF